MDMYKQIGAIILGCQQVPKKVSIDAYNFTGKRYDVGNKLGFLKITVEFADYIKDIAKGLK